LLSFLPFYSQIAKNGRKENENEAENEQLPPKLHTGSENDYFPTQNLSQNTKMGFQLPFWPPFHAHFRASFLFSSLENENKNETK
jgi:hypothetical protein